MDVKRNGIPGSLVATVPTTYSIFGRMIEYGQKEMAWQLFKNMNRQALVEGAVGSLSENADAHPREGKECQKFQVLFRNIL